MICSQIIKKYRALRDKVSYQECIGKNLNVMDFIAFALCKENGLPITVFDKGSGGNLIKVQGKRIEFKK